MMQLWRWTLLVAVVWPSSVWTQVSYNAHDKGAILPENMVWGANPGYHAPWTDEQLSDIAIGNPQLKVDGAGVQNFRPALPEHFLDYWGYDIRVPTFQHYARLGMKKHVLFIGYPSPAHKDTSRHCATAPGETFKNLYQPIWDGGKNGTPVNEENYYALYLYKMVQRYKPFVQVYEVWNEPDFDLSGNGWKPAWMPGNWWQNDPGPCEFAIRAPLYHYIRMLRITWEVVKSIDPDAGIAVGGLGYPSFLDAVLRRTDNPVDGSVTPEYPHTGGAWFDVMSYHSYPHIDGSMREWSNTVGGFVYDRHSDAAVDGVLRKQEEFQQVLLKYGYNGTNRPAKPFILTEVNIPRRNFHDYIGSDEAQRNFIIKCLVETQKHGLKQLHIYGLAEGGNPKHTQDEFHLMGLYQQIEGKKPYQAALSPSGIAWKSAAALIQDASYDAAATLDLQLPAGVRGAAFRKANRLIYVLWARTSKDQSEAAQARYTFPAAFGVKQLVVRNWDYITRKDSLVLDGNSIQLTGAPVFVQIRTNSGKTGSGEQVFDIYPNPFTDSLHVVFYLQKSTKVSLEVFDLNGKPVYTLFNKQTLPAGIYQHDLGETLPTGVYFVRLRVGTEVYEIKTVKAD